jgi:hypothetical protein
MSKRELSRRSFAENLLIGTAAMAWPGYASANHRRTVDLVITAIRWSQDFGVTWHAGPVLEGSDVWFEADVKNIGLAGAAVNRTIQVDFRVNGTLVSSSNTYRSGLSPGRQITLRANTSPDGDEFWNDVDSGNYSIQARVDAPNRFQSEHSESNNTRTVQLIVEGESPPQEAGGLTPSGPVQASANGQVIEGLDITATGTAHGVRVNGFSGVTVRNCRVRHAAGRGILATSAPSLRIEDVDILCTGAPRAGQNPNSNMNNIELQSCSNSIVQRVRCRDGSTGIYVVTSGTVQVRFIEGYNFRGPFPRGQVVQFNQCNAPLLEDFSCENQGNVAWTEDNVNFYGCTNPICRRGFISGNNSPSGQGVIVENTAGGSGGLIEDVDVVCWGNGAFMANGNSAGVEFRRCRARDGIDNGPNNSVGRPDYQGTPVPDWASFVGNLNRGLPSSGSEAFFAYRTAQPNIEFHQCQYYNLPRSGVAWDQSRMSVREFAQVNFTPRAPIRLRMPWEMRSS